MTISIGDLEIHDERGSLRQAPGNTSTTSINQSSSSINYSTGAITLNFSSAPPPSLPINVSYRTFYEKLYEGTGVATNFTGQSAAQLVSGHSVHVEAGSVEGKDDGNGNIVPYFYTNVENEVIGLSGNFANAPIIKGSVLIRSDTTPDAINAPLASGSNSLIFSTSAVNCRPFEP